MPIHDKTYLMTLKHMKPDSRQDKTEGFDHLNVLQPSAAESLSMLPWRQRQTKERYFCRLTIPSALS